MGAYQLELLHVDALALGAGLHPAAVRVPPHHPAAVVAHGRGAGGGGGGARREREREARGICDSRSVGGSLSLSRDIRGGEREVKRGGSRDGRILCGAHTSAPSRTGPCVGDLVYAFAA